MTGTDQEDILHLQALLYLHRRTLHHYLEQQAKLGLLSPPGITHGIYEAREEIRRIKEALQAAGVTEPDKPGDKPVSALGDGSIALAAPGETLLIVVPFAGGFRAATAHPEWTIREALERQKAALAPREGRMRVDLWAMPVSVQSEAREIGAAYGATLVFWGLFDDIVGVKTFVEILRDVPPIAIQLGGQIGYISGMLNVAANFTPLTRTLLLEQLPAQAESLAAVALGIIALIEGHIGTADRLLSHALAAPALAHSDGLCTAYYYRGLVRTLQERFREAQHDLDRALSYTHDSLLALAQRGIVALAVGDAPTAERLFARALDLLPGPNPVEQARLHGNLGLAIEVGGRLDEAQRHYELALALTERGSDPLTRALLLMQLGAMLQQQGSYQEALGWYRTALDVAQETNLPLIEASAHSAIGTLYDATGQPADALRAFGEALKRARASESPGAQAQQLLRLGMLFLDEQLVDEAESLFRQALQLYTRAGLLCGQAQAYSSIALAREVRGDIAVSVAALEQAEALFDRAGSPDSFGVREMLRRLRQ